MMIWQSFFAVHPANAGMQDCLGDIVAAGFLLWHTDHKVSSDSLLTSTEELIGAIGS